MMYVSDRRVDSIWETELAFLVMKSSYMCSHFGGRASRPETELGIGGPELVCLFNGVAIRMIEIARGERQ